jgi:phage shock protein PspC (stress-responsive transcriptional regulator)
MTEPDNPEAPRKLTRSTSDHWLGGVAGGLGRYFGLDPVLFRIAFAISVFFGGLGVLAYIALVAFLPRDDGTPAWVEGRSRATTIVAMVVIAAIALSAFGPPAFILGPGLLGLAVLGLLGVLLYRALGGGGRDDAAQTIARVTLALIVLAAALGAATGVGIVAAIGGGVAVAIIAIVAGVALLAAGLLGGPRWLILPVIVLVVPLAVVSAAGIDLHGGVGDRSYRPTGVASLRPEYRIGAGRLVVDLRSADLPAGNTNVKLVVGVGEAVVRLPAATCVSTDAQVGVGEVESPDGGRRSGLDVAVAQAAPPVAHGQPLVHVKADVGVGHLLVERDGAGASGCA